MAMEILVAITGKIGELLVEPVGRQFGYLIHYKKKIENLKHQLHKLEDQKNGVQQSIDVAIRNGEVILDEVSNWIKSVDEYVEKAGVLLGDDINEKKRSFNGWIPNLITLYRLGKEAKEKTMNVIELQEDGRKFNKLSNPARSLGIESMSSREFVTYETTKFVMMKVWEALRDKTINLIGILGMGGVGKTTLVKEIVQKAKEYKLFDEVLMAIVSQITELKTIQEQLADLLDLQFTVQSDVGRADRLRTRLQFVNRILIILDDVWEGFDISMLGIQVGGHDRDCKIVITTRRAQVCRDMRLGVENLTQKIVNLECLSEPESWDLFKRIATVADDSSKLNSVAKEICKKCQGLPLALLIVGKAMKDKELEKWKEVARELKKSVPTTIEGVDKHVFNCLKLSYDHLGNEEAKSCFLLCSMFPEDFNIPIESLVRYGVGMYMFKNMDTINDARGRANSVIKNLIDSSLLLASEREWRVKMHKVVRMAAIYIGSNRYYIRTGGEFRGWPIMESYSEFKGISLIGGDSSELSPAKFSNLQILLLEGYVISERNNDISFFEGMKSLKVLYLRGHNTKFTFSPNMCTNLICLRTLILERMMISNTAFLVLIKTLEVLSLKESRLYDMPTETWELTNLRLLDLEGCNASYDGIHTNLRILPNVIMHMSRVEELYLFDTIIEHGAITTLNSLRHLTVLTISIDDVRIIPEDFVFPDLEKFFVRIGCSNAWLVLLSYNLRREYYKLLYLVDPVTTPNTLVLQGLVGPRVQWLGWVKMLLKRTHTMVLFNLEDVKNIVPNISCHGDSLKSLKILWVSECGVFEYLIDIIEALGDSPSHNQQVLPDLEELRLNDLSTLKGICNGTVSSTSGNFLSSRLVHFHNLRVVVIYECHRLRCIFRTSVARSLQQLEELSVSWCGAMEEIVEKEDEEEEEETVVDNNIVLNSLKTLRLGVLPSLGGFCTRSFIFEWPSLEEVIVVECPKMKTFAATFGLQSTPKLKSITLDGDDKMLEGVDLNTIIGNYFKEQEKQSTTSEAGPS